MTGADVADTRRRAEIRGRESVARWRIESGVWSGRFFAAIYLVVAILPLLGGGRETVIWMTALAWLVIAAAIFFATEQMKRGSVTAACSLLALFILAKIGDWRLAGVPPWSGLLWTIILGGGLANGVWGALALASARRDAASVPPAPARKAAPTESGS